MNARPERIVVLRELDLVIVCGSKARNRVNFKSMFRDTQYAIFQI